MWRIHRWPVNSPHKWPVTRKMFPYDDVIILSIIAGYPSCYKTLSVPHLRCIMVPCLHTESRLMSTISSNERVRDISDTNWCLDQGYILPVGLMAIIHKWWNAMHYCKNRYNSFTNELGPGLPTKCLIDGIWQGFDNMASDWQAAMLTANQKPGLKILVY